MSELLRSLGKKFQRVLHPSENPQFSSEEKKYLERVGEANARMILGRLSMAAIPLSFETDKRAGLLLDAMDSPYYTSAKPDFDSSRSFSRTYNMHHADPSIVMLCEDGLYEVITSASYRYLTNEMLTGRFNITSLRGTESDLNIPHETEILVFRDLSASVRREQLTNYLTLRGYPSDHLNVVNIQFMTTPEKRSFTIRVPNKSGKLEERRYIGIDVQNQPKDGTLSYFQFIPSPLTDSQQGIYMPLSFGLFQTVPSRA